MDLPYLIPRGSPRDLLKEPSHTTTHLLKRSIVKPTLNNAGGEAERRFDQFNLAFVHVVETLLLDAANSEDIPEIPEAVSEYFQNKIDVACLKVQLPMLQDAVSQHRLCWICS